MSTAPHPEAPPVADPALLARLEPFVGAGADRPGFIARHPVSHAAIGRMIDAVGDRNPVYADEVFARASVHGSIVAPPLWLYSWMMPGLQTEAGTPVLEDGAAYFHLAPAGQRSTTLAAPTIRDELNAVFDTYGYVVPAVTNMIYTYHRYLRVGETPRFSSWIIDAISGPKQTKLGEGFFVTLHIDVLVGDERVASISQRYLRSKPAARSDGAVAKPAAVQAAPRTAAPVIQGSAPFDAARSTRRFGQVKVGDTLPPLVVRISPTLIIAGALASNDYQDIHHDHHIMAQRGHPDIFMNMMTTSGLLGRYVSDWAGPEAVLRGHELRLLRPNYPGDTMRLTGTVSAVEIRDGRGLLTINLLGTNSLGTHTDSSVVVELPL